MKAVEGPQDVADAQHQAGKKEVDNKEAMRKAAKEETERLKLKYMAKVNMLVEDKDLQEKLHKVVVESIDEGILVGRAIGVHPGAMNFMADSIKSVIERVTSPTDAARAAKYRQLYLNQRVITSHLQAAAQLLQLQVGEYEAVDADPFASPFSRSLGDVLGATELAMAPFKDFRNSEKG